MSSRCGYKWKVVKHDKGDMERASILRLVLPGFMGLEVFDVETFSVTARRSRQRLFASAAACKMQWAIASLDINMAFLEGLADQGLAEAKGEKGARGVFHAATWIGIGVSIPRGIRALR
eukprot:3278066-Pyramimonas_sp.AAC.1